MSQADRKWRLEDGRFIHVVDGLFDPTTLERFQYFIDEYALWKRDTADDEQYGEFAQIGITFDGRSFQNCFIWNELAPLIENAGGKPYHLYTVNMNHIVYGDHNFAHRDCDLGADEVTALVYLNRDFDKNSYGETVFFDEEDEVITSVAPKFGRVSFFSGSIMHCARQPSRLTLQPRYTLALKSTDNPDRAEEESSRERRIKAIQAERRRRFETEFFGEKFGGY